MDEKTYQDTISWLTLIRAPGLSPGIIKQLLLRFSHPKNIITADKFLLQSIGLDDRTVNHFQNPDPGLIDTDIDWIAQKNHDFIHLLHPHYPDLLMQLPDPPCAIFVSGNIKYLSMHSIAVIGSRKPTPGGKKIACQIAHQLGTLGIVVTSGLAYGVDTSAHVGALKGDGGTIAVLGSGLDFIYPKSNHALAEEISENGLLISEFPLKTKPLPHHFPRRNRIISGISLGVLVVEATLKSGSLITANLAAEQGREVFAVPGSILNPAAEGCHKLISTGAKLTTNIQDIVEEIPCLQQMIINQEETRRISQVNNETLDEQAKLLLDNIGYEPVSYDEIIINSGITVEKLRVMLPELELKDLIQSTSGGRFVRK